MSVANSGGSPNKSVVDTGQVKIVKKSVERAQVRPDWTNYVSSQINNPTMCSVCIQRHCFKCEHRMTDEERILYIIGDANKKKKDSKHLIDKETANNIINKYDDKLANLIEKKGTQNQKTTSRNGHTIKKKSQNDVYAENPELKNPNKTKSKEERHLNDKRSQVKNSSKKTNSVKGKVKTKEAIKDSTSDEKYAKESTNKDGCCTIS